MDTLKQLTLDDYLTRLASGAAAPGGGAAAALTGAQAAALLAMVVRVTLGHTPGPESQQELLLGALDAARGSLLELATADGQAFSAVMQAYKLPSGNDAEKTARREAIQAGLKGATEVPLAVMRGVFGLFDQADAVLALAKPTVVSDAAIALHLMTAALKAARYNVRINLKYLKDESFSAHVEQTVRHLLAQAKKRRRPLLKQVRKLLH